MYRISRIKDGHKEYIHCVRLGEEVDVDNYIQAGHEADIAYDDWTSTYLHTTHVEYALKSNSRNLMEYLMLLINDSEEELSWEIEECSSLKNYIAI